MRSMKSPLPLGLMVTTCLLVSHAPSLLAQSPLASKWREDIPAAPYQNARRSVVALPLPTPPAPVDLRPSATFTFADATQIKARSSTGRFRLVGLHFTESVDIAVQFPAVPINSSATAQPLDGGRIVSFSISPAGTGSLASIRFQAGNQRGFYRVLVRGVGTPALLQFWVANPNSSSAINPILLNPNH